MKKVVNVSIGRRKFTLNEDAYTRLNTYLDAFKAHTRMGLQASEVMEDLEMRIADLFEERTFAGEAVSLELVESIISQLGMPDGDQDASRMDFSQDASSSSSSNGAAPAHKFYRDMDSARIGGVCSGIASYFDVDLTMIRIAMFVLLLAGSIGFWFYLICWIVAPKAVTPAQKCELRGWPVTAENMAKFRK